MEVIGVVASFIAIGQVLVSGRHVIDILREIPAIRGELTWLNNEIETLRLVVEKADMQGTSTDPFLPEMPLLGKARLQLNEVVADLKQVHMDCIRADGEDGKVKVKRMKWFLQQKRLSECRKKACEARVNILAALQTMQLKESRDTRERVLRIETFTMETHRAMVLASSSSKNFNGSSRRLQRPQACDMEELHRPRPVKPINQLTPELEQLVLAGNRSKKSNKPPHRSSDSVIINVSLSELDKCPQPCGCRCHAWRPASYKSADWARTLIGSISLGYKQQLDYDRGAKCNSKACRSSGKASAHFSYRFPAWLCSRLVSFQASWSASGEISVSLRPVRVLSPNDGFWGCVKSGSRTDMRQLMHYQGIIYPGDVDSHGATALQVRTIPQSPSPAPFCCC
ncbi:hypothetical protein LZ31DRAFT_95784 [Colletotrichum somersetense]|nr:hypothetical protein LZ31DRAFT_95784 [Colletotrichum somersetense]